MTQLMPPSSSQRSRKENDVQLFHRSPQLPSEASASIHNPLQAQAFSTPRIFCEATKATSSKDVLDLAHQHPLRGIAIHR
jgi:hypothetical protein